MVKKGLKLGTWHNATGHNYTALGGNGGGATKQRLSTTGFYHIALVKEYTGLTERDLDLRIDYGKDLVHQHIGVPTDMINLRKKTENQTLSSVDTVYYVRVGQQTVGKLAIRVRRSFRDRSLIFVYSHKDVRPKSIGYKPNNRRIGGETKAQNRQRKRKKPQARGTN